MSDASKAVFLSYASQDADAARKICEALRGAGVEVWFDQSELRGGDAWDQKIRKQIKECALFVPVISASTQARLEGYFRLEWKLAAQRTHTMADAKPFLVPVCIDDTRDADAHVPEEFRAVQWTRLPRGEAPGTFCARLQNLLRAATDVAAPSIDQRAAAATPVPPIPAGTRHRGRWAAAAFLVLSGAGVGWWMLPRAPGVTGQASVVTRATSAPSGRSEARLMAEKARNLSASGPALEANERVLQRAAELDPHDADIWGIWAQIHARHADAPGWPKARRDAAWAKARQAMKLAPDSFHARLGYAAALAAGREPKALEEAEKLLRQLLAERPDDPGALLFLKTTLSFAGRPLEAATIAEQNMGKKDMWELYFARRYREAEELMDEYLADPRRNPAAHAGVVVAKAQVALWWDGDVDRAKAVLERLPPGASTSDWGLWTAWHVYQWRREPQQALAVLKSAPTEWIACRSYVGPKAFLAGEAYLADGRQDAARLAFRRALQLIENHLATDPEDRTFLAMKAQCQEHVGEHGAAVQTWRLHDQLGGGTPRPLTVDERIADLERIVRGISDGTLNGRTWDGRLTAASLRLNPAYDALRAHPKFAALQARLDADPAFTPNPTAGSLAAPKK